MLHSIWGSGVPSSTPTTYNQHYVNTTNGDIYMSKGISSSADWVKIYPASGGGAGSLLAANNLSDLASVSSARSNLGLGSAALLNVGTSANNVVQLNSSAQLPAVDGSLLTNLPASSNALQKSANLSDVSNITAARNSLGLGSAATLSVGVSAYNIVQLTAAGKLPAVDGSLLTNLPVSGGGLVASNNLSDLPSPSTARSNLGLGTAATQSVGTASGNVVQLQPGGLLPAVDASQLVNVPIHSEMVRKPYNLGDLPNISAARANLGLTSIATIALSGNSGEFLNGAGSFAAMGVGFKGTMVRVADFATGGDGSFASPYTGWESACPNSTAGNDRYYIFDSGKCFATASTFDQSGVTRNTVWDGFGTARIMYTGASAAPVFQIYNPTADGGSNDAMGYNLTVRGLLIDGKSNGSVGLKMNAIHWCTFESIMFINVPKCIEIRFAVCNTYSKIYARGAQAVIPGESILQTVTNGIEVGSTGGVVTCCTFNDCWLAPSSGYGIKMGITYCCDIIGGAAELCGTGYWISSSAESTFIQGVDAEVCSSANYLIEGTNTTLIAARSSAGTVSIAAGARNTMVIGCQHKTVTVAAGAYNTQYKGGTVRIESGTFTDNSGGVTFDNTWDAAQSKYLNSGLPCEFIVAVSDTTTALTTGTGKATFTVPFNFAITEIICSVMTAQSSGSILTFNIKKNGVTLFTTKPTIDNTELSTLTAATPMSIFYTAMAKGDVLTFDIDQVGSGGLGATVSIIGKRAL